MVKIPFAAWQRRGLLLLVAALVSVTSACNDDSGSAGAKAAIVHCKTEADCPQPALACHVAACKAGVCAIALATDGTPCDDQNPCTTGDACSIGGCVSGKSLICDDKSPCTDDTCKPEAGCVSLPNTASCSDGNACTTTDTCNGGACVPGPAPTCDDKNPCTDDSCDPKTGCITAPNTLPCDDGSACTVLDVCAAGSCKPGAAAVCNDGNPCTDDSCDAAKGCVALANTATCSDGNACSTNDACSGGACLPGPAPACDDKNPCTDDSCDPKTGCITAPNTLPCDDGSACTVLDICAAGTCKPGAAAVCNDGNPCTDDSCDAAKGCVTLANTVTCSDGNVCTLSDVCADKACVPGLAKACDDQDPCTSETCDPKAGCVYAKNSLPCTDGSVCTIGDLCKDGMCSSGSPVGCDDGNPCTDDSCDKVSGCVHAPNTAPCDDTNGCTTGDVCAGGKCTPGAGCSDNAMCYPGPKAVYCGCNSGYGGNGFVCQDINECQTGAFTCAPGMICVNVPGKYNCACAQGYAECNGKAADGCETYSAGDPSNCGGCGKVCSSKNVASNVCDAGVCSGTCTAGFADCNGDKLVDGCETAIAGSDTANCGGCGVKCGSGQACSAGKCVTQVCTANTISCSTTSYAEALVCKADGTDADVWGTCAAGTFCAPYTQPHACDTACGAKAPSGCFCDADCAKMGDCCGVLGTAPDASNPAYNCGGSTCGACNAGISGKVVCQAQVCTPNQVGCNGSVAATCNANGSAYLSGGVDCKAKGEVCAAGKCVSADCSEVALSGGVYGTASGFVAAWPASWTVEGWSSLTGSFGAPWGGGLVGTPAVELGCPNNWMLEAYPNGVVHLGAFNGQGVSTSSPGMWAANVPFHYAVVYSSSDKTLRAFVNGKQAASIANIGPDFCTKSITLHSSLGSNSNWATGSAFSLRYSEVARYAGPFVPPKALGADASTKYLFDFAEGTGSASKSADGSKSFSFSGPVTWPSACTSQP